MWNTLRWALYFPGCAELSSYSISHFFFQNDSFAREVKFEDERSSLEIEPFERVRVVVFQWIFFLYMSDRAVCEPIEY